MTRMQFSLYYPPSVSIPRFYSKAEIRQRQLSSLAVYLNRTYPNMIHGLRRALDHRENLEPILRAFYTPEIASAAFEIAPTENPYETFSISEMRETAMVVHRLIKHHFTAWEVRRPLEPFFESAFKER